jgi:hypothetical protein
VRAAILLFISVTLLQPLDSTTYSPSWRRSHPKVALHVAGGPNCKSSALIHVKPFYGADRRGTWSIGSGVVLKERPDEGPKTEVTTLAYLTSNPNTNIPAPKVLRDWVDANERCFVPLEGMRGQTVE